MRDVDSKFVWELKASTVDVYMYIHVAIQYSKGDRALSYYECIFKRLNDARPQVFAND